MRCSVSFPFPLLFSFRESHLTELFLLYTEVFLPKTTIKEERNAYKEKRVYTCFSAYPCVCVCLTVLTEMCSPTEMWSPTKMCSPTKVYSPTEKCAFCFIVVAEGTEQAVPGSKVFGWVLVLLCVGWDGRTVGLPSAYFLGAALARGSVGFVGFGPAHWRRRYGRSVATPPACVRWDSTPALSRSGCVPVV